ncbi:MAG: NAD(P)/FAD-dependent oxidoreductase [Bryobacteraceae bacterium]|jgi:flavin-dependent dehydrogenase
MADPDVFVIGGGPAGLAVAIAARRKGWNVVVADGNRPPIDKACGEGLMPDSRRAAARIGIQLPDSLGFEFRGVRFHGAGRFIEADFPGRARGIGVRRVRLHEALVETAAQAGVELRWGVPIASLEDVRARWIIGADGAGSRVRRWAGLDARARNSHRFSYRRHYSIAPWTDYMEIHWGEGCQIYVTPVGPQEVCLALISRTQDLRLDDALRRFFPALDERLAGSEIASRERGAITATMRLRSVTRGNVALVGDASGSVDAISGDGLCLSFKQAGLLTDAMARGDLARYCRLHPRLATKPNFMTKTMLVLDRGPKVRRWAFGALSAQPWIFEKLLAVHVAG